MEDRTLSTELLIIGGGGSGLVAALRASELGFDRILVLDKENRTGGNALMAHGFYGVNPVSSKVRRAYSPKDPAIMYPADYYEFLDNIEDPKYGSREDAVFRETMRFNRWTAYPEIVRAYVNNSGKFIDWLYERGLDIEYEDNFRCKPYIPAVSAGNTSLATGGRIGVGSVVVDFLYKECAKTENIEFLMSTRATELILGPDGAVLGALAESDDGKLRVEAKATILATGGFAANPELLKKYFPMFYLPGSNIDVVTLKHATGDGMLMAEKAGARVGEDIGLLAGGPGHHWWAFTIASGAACAFSMWVNSNGRRYVDESAYKDETLDATNLQPGGDSFSVVGTDTIEAWLDLPKTPRNEELIAEFYADLEKQVESGRGIMKAGTVEELAGFIGADPAVLKESVDRYNACYDNQYDSEFLKEPKHLKPIKKAPFYAVKFRRFHDSTHGGVTINERLEVQCVEGGKINGLYATGDNASGWTSQDYGPFATSLTWCFNSGYLAAQSVAEYLGFIE